jgi:flagellar basal-body rod protein FlgB
MAPLEQVSPLHDTLSRVLTKSLDAASLRHRVIADNLANIETPGFQAQDVSFTERLRAALESTREQPHTSALAAMEQVEPAVVLATDGTQRLDGATVDVDVEMTKIAENSGRYQAVAQMIQTRLEMLRIAINDGRR